MAQILVRDLDMDIVKRLKVQARQNGRSLQGEIKIILVQAATLSMSQALALSKEWHKRLKGRIEGDSAELIREDRAR